MGFDPVTMGLIGAGVNAALPLMTNPEEQNQTNMTQPQSSRNVRMPQGMATQGQPQGGNEMQTMQMLMALMQSLSQMQSAPGGGQAQIGQTPQPGVGPPPQTAGGITPGQSNTGVY